MEKLSQSLEDYLEIIYNEIEKKSKVKAIDISRHFGVSRASVTEALNKLCEKGYINYEKYGHVSITEMGRLKACEIVFLHNELTQFFTNLGVNLKDSEDAACKIEHIIPVSIKEKIIAFNNYCKKNPKFKI